MISATEGPVQIDQVVSWLGRVVKQVNPDEAARALNVLAENPETARRIIRNADDLLEKLSKLSADDLKAFIQELKIRARLF